MRPKCLRVRLGVSTSIFSILRQTGTEPNALLILLTIDFVDLRAECTIHFLDLRIRVDFIDSSLF